ncbi:MAG: hypothetical protein KIG60_08165 [Caryophanon sp.]|nr:hypothetical protein [Caryophanon sp.]
MKPKFFLIMSMFLLAACSEEVDQTKEQTVKIEQQEADIKEEQSEQQEASTSEEDDTSSNETEEETSTEPKADSEKDASSDTTVTDTKVEVAEVTEKTDFYEYYVSNGVAKEPNEDVNNTDAKGAVYETLTEGVIELPKLENNETVFEQKTQTITIADLEKISAIRYMEEPATLGNLLIVDMNLLKSHYLGKSYSLTFNDEEYGMVVSEEKQSVGIILMRNTKDLIDEIKSDSVINIMN